MSYLDEERKIVSELLAVATKDIPRSQYQEYQEKTMALAVLHDLNLQKTDTGKYFLRKRRREKYIKQGIIIPPGDWDEDLDMYNDNIYSVHIGKGYTGKIQRNIMLSWNGYVTVPEGHWSIGKDLSKCKLPFEITYHNDREIGFSHCHCYDKIPLGHFMEDQNTDSRIYTPFMKVMKEVNLLAEALMVPQF